jgi:hypothetical protein
MADFDDNTVSMAYIAAKLQFQVDAHTSGHLKDLSNKEKEAFNLGVTIRKLAEKLQGKEKHFETSNDPLNLEAYKEHFEYVQEMGEKLAEDKLSPITLDHLPLTKKLNLNEINGEDLWHLQNTLAILAEELPNVARRTTNQMADKTAAHYQTSLVNAKVASANNGMAESSVRNQKTN